MNRKHIARISAAAFFLLLFTAYYANLTLFCHTHIINGVTLVHSHFHSEHHHDTDEGGHTVTELTLIANLTGQFLTTGDMPRTELTHTDICLRTIGFTQDAVALAPHLSLLSLRAPPTL